MNDRWAAGRPRRGRRAVHDVVVDQGEGVEQLEGGAGVDHRGVVRVAAGADVGPVAERRPQPLAAGHDQVGHGVDDLGEVGVDVDPPGPLARRGRRRAAASARAPATATAAVGGSAVGADMPGR